MKAFYRVYTKHLEDGCTTPVLHLSTDNYTEALNKAKELLNDNRKDVKILTGNLVINLSKYFKERPV